MFTPIKVYDKDVREDGTIPQNNIDGPGIMTYFMACCDIRYDFKNKYIAIAGHMHGSMIETRIPVSFMESCLERVQKSSIAYALKYEKPKEYYHMWE